MGIIAGFKEGSKRFLGRIGADWIIVAIILLSASGSFGLGFLAGKDVGGKGEMRIIQRDLIGADVATVEAAKVSQPEAPPMASGGQYVASKTGKSYHLPWCGGAKQIKEENKVWFASKEEAEAKGYTPAGNCPGI